MHPLAALLEPLQRIVRDAPHEIRIRELPRGVALDGYQLQDAVATQVSALRRMGVKSGDCVLLCCPNSAAFAIAVLACWKAGASCLLADGSSTAAELKVLSNLFHPSAAIGVPPGSTTLSRVRSLVCWNPSTITGRRPTLPPQTAVIKLTSGTLGDPRGVVVTAPQLMTGGRQIVETMGIRPHDVNIAAIPMCHSYGFDNLIMPLILQGSPIAVVPEVLPGNLGAALGMVETCVFPGVPYLFDLLCRIVSPWKPTGLKLCLSAGAPLPSAVRRAFGERYGLRVRSFYGTTETGGITFERAGDAIAPEGCVGKPLVGVSVKIEPAESVDVHPTKGRIVVESDAVAHGYFPADPSAGALTRGRFETGDIGRFDRDGQLHLVGRLGFLINVGGRKVNPIEVERILRELPRVRDAVVVPVADPRRGQALAACIEAEPGLTPATVLEELGERLPRYKMPRILQVVKDLPRTGRGKPDRARIQKVLSLRGPDPSSR